MSRILLTTFGSLGDLHPYLAIGQELKSRGHFVVIATHAGYRRRAEAVGLEFASVGVDYERLGDLAGAMREAMDERRGSEIVLQKFVLPYLRESRDSLLRAAIGADLMVDHVLTFAAPLVCEKLGLPRVSTTLQPMAMFSAHDPPRFPAAPFVSRLPFMGPAVWNVLWRFARWVTRHWFRELDAMRREMGLRRQTGHPMIDGASRDLHLVLFSRELMPPQPDWPAAAVQPGFCTHDRGEAGAGMPVALTRWLDAGAPPLVFTLGSSAVFAAETFYDDAAAAALALGRRAVLLTGLEGLNPVTGVPSVEAAPLDAPVVAVTYAPHSEVMPHACAVIHQGGVGTTAQAMLSGRPMLVVPFSHDQPDNAARCARLGIARVLPRARMSVAAFVRELTDLLADPNAAEQARLVAARMRSEPGAPGAADAIERLLAKRVRN